MSILKVSGEELLNAKGDIDGLLAKFNNTYSSFQQKLNELGNYWIGDDYMATKNNVLDRINPLLDESNGQIPNILKEISSELERKNDSYTNIQKTNMREDY